MGRLKQAVRVITEEEFLLLLKTIKEDEKEKVFGKDYQDFCKIRDITIYCMMMGLGLRPRECYEAKVRDINLNKREWIIPFYNNKQRQTDVIQLPDFIFRILYGYMEKRIVYGFQDSEWLFPTRHFRSKGKLSRNSINIKFKYYCQKAGLLNLTYIDANGQMRGDLHPYILRHSFGTRAYEKLGDINKVRILMRHRDLRCRATFLYVHLNDNLKRGEYLEKLYEDHVPLII